MNKRNGISKAVGAAASEQLGVEYWDRPAIFRETADAAASSDLPYWVVLVLSGAIATLGLAIDSSAVVIGAMLVAPLLAPVVGLALSLAVGDGRLAIQTGVVVLGSTIAVIAIGALLTVLLPFHTITLEISARARPTSLDLAIAIFSGLVGAVVTVARGNRLSAAIPGVAISVALIPPLAVAGFGIGIGWEGELIRGSLLLYSANLAGIVLSAMTVFLLVGMHRENVLAAASRWHREKERHGLAAWANRVRWVRSLEVFHSLWSRVGLVVAFVVALAAPLSQTLAEITRESRVERAVEAAATVFEVPGRASILGRQVVLGRDRTQVNLRVATTEWFGEEMREAFERQASARAGEPVRLQLEQLPARGEDLEQLAALFPRQEPRPTRTPPPPPRLVDLLADARSRLQQGMARLVLPEGVAIAGFELTTTARGDAVLRIAYAAPDSLTAQAEQMLHRQLERVLDLPMLETRFAHVSTAPRPWDGATADTALLRALAGLVRAHEALGLEIIVPQASGRQEVQPVLDWLAGVGLTAERITWRESADPDSQGHIRVMVRETTQPDPQQ